MSNYILFTDVMDSSHGISGPFSHMVLMKAGGEVRTASLTSEAEPPLTVTASGKQNLGEIRVKQAARSRDPKKLDKAIRVEDIKRCLAPGGLPDEQ